jgi:hypothetical protein
MQRCFPNLTDWLIVPAVVKSHDGRYVRSPSVLGIGRKLVTRGLMLSIYFAG